MERALRILLRVSPRTRNWIALSNYISPLQSEQTILQTYSTNSTDSTKSERYIPIKEKNHAFDDARISHHMKILESAAANYSNMSTYEAVQTMSTLLNASKNVENVENIGKHIGFIRLCEVLNRDVRFMKINDIIGSLKALTYFKIPSNILLTQSLLQVVRVTLNQLSLRNIIFITFLLKKMDSTPLRDALLIALPIVFETQFSTKFDTDDGVLLIWSLRFITEHNILNAEIQDIILKTLLKYKDHVDIQTAKSIFYSLSCISDPPPMTFEVLFDIQKILISRAKELNVQEITRTLDRIVFITATNEEQSSKFYNEALVDALINSALFSNVNFTNGIYLLKTLNSLNHIHIPFLEYLAAKCFEEPNLLKDASYFKMCIFIEGFINADYKPIFWDTIRDAILASEMKTKSFNKSLVKFALHLIALDCYSPNLLNKAFLQNNESTKNLFAMEMLTLYQSVKTLYPMYCGSWPSQNIVEYATTLKPKSPTFFLKGALERALGGPQYVYHDLRTKLGHYIDHTVVMRKGGYPVAVNSAESDMNDIVYVEDIERPSESQTILIFNLPDVAYAINSQRLKSTWSLKIKSAEALTGFNTIAINSSLWMKLPEYERVPYLMQAIKLKCEDLSLSVN